jgi:hypothetical protein
MKSSPSLITPLLLLLSTSAITGFAPPRHTPLSKSALHDVTPHVSDLINILLSPDALDASAASEAVSSLADPAAADVANEASDSFLPTYSKASYYTTLALYVASFPGLWSQIKRSTKAKVKRKTYVR